MGYPSDLLFYAKYNSSLDADFSKYGNVVRVDDNKVSIDTGIKKFGVGSLKKSGQPAYIKYSGGGEVGQTGTFSFWVYLNTLDINQVFELKNTGSDNNYIRLGLYPYPLWKFCKLQIWSSTGKVIIDTTALPFLAVIHTWYHIELNFDITIGATRLFIDGVQTGATITNTGIRSTITDYFYMPGNDPQNNIVWIDDFRIYDTVQHTSNFTPPVQELQPTSVVNTFGYPFGFPSKRGLAR